MTSPQNCKQQENESDSKTGRSISKSRKKGPDFMASRIAVVEMKLDLSIKKVITPMESNLLTLIELGTIGAQNKKYDFCSTAEFDIRVLSDRLGYKEMDKIYALLKNLTSKRIIHRQKTDSKNIEILGLHPDTFGQVLIEKLHLNDLQKRLRLVVDNTPDEPTNRRDTTDESSGNNLRTVGEFPTNRRLANSQPLNITEEKKQEMTESSRIFKNLKEGGDKNHNFGEEKYIEMPSSIRDTLTSIGVYKK